MMLPFQETKIGDNVFVREFSQDTDSGELMWHRDREDRIVEPIGDTDWMVQLDNELPKKIEGKVFIPMGVSKYLYRYLILSRTRAIRVPILPGQALRERL